MHTSDLLNDQSKAVLRVLVQRIERINPSRLNTYPSYTEIHEDLGLSMMANTIGQSLINQGAGDLAEWTKANNFPGITGLIVEKSTSLPSMGYFNLFQKDEIEGAAWLPSEIQRAKEYDWSPYTTTGVTKSNTKNLSVSAFFEQVLGVKLTNLAWSWCAYNQTSNQVFLKLWNTDFIEVDGDTYIRVHYENDHEVDTKNLGFVRRSRHLKLKDAGVPAYGVIQTPRKNRRPDQSKILSFDHEELAMLGGTISVEGTSYAKVLRYVSIDAIRDKEFEADPVLADIEDINNSNIQETEKKQLTNARVGQGKFRKQVLGQWNNTCCVTGFTLLDCVVASHIKPWRKSDNAERLSPDNGLPLISHLDKLFDRGWISFTTAGNIMISEALGDEDRERIGLNTSMRLTKEPNELMQFFLKHHNEREFLR